MEEVNINSSTYRQIMLQHGAGYDDGGYYHYSQEGDGLGSFFSNLLKYAVPVLGRTIKGAARIAKPHLQKAGAELVAAGAKRISKELTNKRKKPRRKI